MMLAFLISAHTDPQQLKRLIEALPDESRFFVHIDIKSDITQFTDVIKDKRVQFIDHRVNVVWGSIVEVEYQMELIRAALEYEEHFDYLITLSGLDYPLWSKQSITEFFTNSKGKEFLCGNDISWQYKAAKLYREYRILAGQPWKNGSIKNKCRVLLRKVLALLGIRKPLIFSVNGKEYRLYKGAAWWAISEDMASFVLDKWDNEKEFVNYFKTSFCPAETFTQTVVFNNEDYRRRCVLVEGTYKSLADLTPLTYIYYNPVIKILTEEDYSTLKESGKTFARKFISGKSDNLVNMLPL